MICLENERSFKWKCVKSKREKGESEPFIWNWDMNMWASARQNIPCLIYDQEELW